MRGRTGLKRQLGDRRDSDAIRDVLVRYPARRAGSASWRARFQRAVRRYLGNPSEVRLYGVLVRDVGPREDDLRRRVDELGAGCPEGTCIELLAFHLPPESLDGAGEGIVSRRAGAGR